MSTWNWAMIETLMSYGTLRTAVSLTEDDISHIKNLPYKNSKYNDYRNTILAEYYAPSKCNFCKEDLFLGVCYNVH